MSETPNIRYLPSTEPPECLDTAQPCLGCEALPDCGFLQKGLGFLAVAQERDQYATDNSRLEGHINFLSWDRLMDGFLTPGAFDLALVEQSSLRNQLEIEIETGKVGAITLDVRGLNMINAISHPAGNVFLEIVGHRIKQSVRHADTVSYRGIERRHADSPLADILLVRQGGDEVGVLMRGIDETAFERRVADLRTSLSIERALSAEDPLPLPLIASVGSFHASRLELPATWGTKESVLYAVNKMLGSADKQALSLRDAQYKELWQRACEKEPSLIAFYPAPPDKTVIASKFFQTNFPTFAANIEATLQAVQARIEDTKFS
jgi:GGDEF domain-containing protein